MSIKLNPYLKILKHGHGPIRGPTVCKFRERNWGVKISWDCPINNKWSRETVPLIINVFWVLILLLFMSEKSIYECQYHTYIYFWFTIIFILSTCVLVNLLQCTHALVNRLQCTAKHLPMQVSCTVFLVLIFWTE